MATEKYFAKEMVKNLLNEIISIVKDKYDIYNHGKVMAMLDVCYKLAKKSNSDCALREQIHEVDRKVNEWQKLEQFKLENYSL